MRILSARQITEKFFGGKLARAAKAFNVNRGTFRNWMGDSEMELHMFVYADGQYVPVTKKKSWKKVEIKDNSYLVESAEFCY